MEAFAVKTARYVIAKYIPDLQRMEPRNIGVIVWSPHGVQARFMAEREARPGEIDGRRAPRFLTSVTAYRQWVNYWRTQLNSQALEPVNSSESVQRANHAFVDVLIASTHGNFVLNDAGFVLDPVPAEELSDLTNYLYSTLVEDEGTDEPRDLTLDTICDELISTAGLKSDPHFHTRLSLDVELNQLGVFETLEFSYGYKNGSIQRLYQRVPLAGSHTAIRKNVHDCAWMFEKAIASRVVDKEQTAALVYLPEEESIEPSVESMLSVLRSETRIVNVENRPVALKELQGFGASDS
jgi:hypothetical protein